MSFKIQAQKAQFWADIHQHWVEKKPFMRRSGMYKRYRASPSTIEKWIKAWRETYPNSDFLFK